MSAPALSRIAEIQDPSGRVHGYVARERLTRVHRTRAQALLAANRARAAARFRSKEA